MRIQPIIWRLVALLVLLSSACDYCAFDLYDSEASMSRPGPVLFGDRGQDSHAVAAKTSDLPDDHCLCCSPIIVSQSAKLEGPFLISSTLENRVIQPPIPEAQVIEQPPRS
jgi:hypothetical protein